MREQQAGRDIGTIGVADGELTSLTQGSTVTSFTYDAAQRRVSRTSGGTTTDFLYDGGAVLLEKQGSTTTATYTYGNALIRKDGETPLFDGLGSERTVTNSSQTVTGTATYEGFGQTVATTGSSTDPYMFAATSGYRNDGDAGLMHVGARYYDAQVGRFITRDTELDQKPYLYCEGDPVNHLDPSGHDIAGWWNHLGGGWKGIIVGGGILIALPIAFPLAAGTFFGSIAIGGAAGIGGVLASGSADDDSIEQGMVGGGLGGAIAGQALGPWWGPASGFVLKLIKSAF